jgi:hypothetical protein
MLSKEGNRVVVHLRNPGKTRESALKTNSTIPVSLSLFPVAPTSEHRASVERFVSLQFLNPKTVGRTLWTGDQPVARLFLTKYTQCHIILH